MPQWNKKNLNLLLALTWKRQFEMFYCVTFDVIITNIWSLHQHMANVLLFSWVIIEPQHQNTVYSAHNQQKHVYTVTSITTEVTHFAQWPCPSFHMLIRQIGSIRETLGRKAQRSKHTEILFFFLRTNK